MLDRSNILHDEVKILYPDSLAVPPQAVAPQRRQLSLDASAVSIVYANYFRITGTSEELVLDFGLNCQVDEAVGETVKLTHRLVMSLFSAKRLLHGLDLTVRRHEATFGAVEVDTQQRLRSH